MICEAANGATTPGGGRDPRGPRRPRAPRRRRERGRRRRLVLRVGPGPPGVLLEGVRGEREAERHRRARVRGDLVGARALRRRACGWPPTGSRCSGSPRRRRRGGSIRSTDRRCAGRAADARRVVVFTAPGCHLCGPARRRPSARCAATISTSSTSRPIPSSSGATARRIPVVEVDEIEQCRYVVDEAALSRSVGTSPG